MLLVYKIDEFKVQRLYMYFETTADDWSDNAKPMELQKESDNLIIPNVLFSRDRAEIP